MHLIYRYRIIITLVCLFFLYSQGLCQEDAQEEITWEDIEGISNSQVTTTPLPVTPPPAAQKPVVTQVTPVQPEKVEVRQVKAPAQVLPEAEKKVAPLPVVKAKKVKPAAARKQVSADNKRPSQEEGALKRATTITSEDPAANRDLFITNPDRE
jgi:type IV secretory pathway VirB10-like protein